MIKEPELAELPRLCAEADAVLAAATDIEAFREALAYAERLGLLRSDPALAAAAELYTIFMLVKMNY